ERLDGDGVLEAGQSGLAGQVAVRGGAVGDELEGGVGAEGIVVVLVLVAGQNAVDAGADHFQQGMLDERGGAGVIEGIGEGLRESDALIELADREQPGIAGELTGRRLDDERGAEEVERLGPGRWYTHRLSPGEGKKLVGSPAKTRTEINYSKPR